MVDVWGRVRDGGVVEKLKVRLEMGKVLGEYMYDGVL